LIGIVIVALLFHSGCSFLFVKGPPEQHAQMWTFDCSESNAFPILDTIWAGLNGLGAITAAGDSTTPNQTQVIAVGTSWLVVSGISAIYGFSKVSACNEARRQREERYQKALGGPSAVPAPGPGPALPAGAAPPSGAPRGAPAAPPPPGSAPAVAPPPPVAPPAAPPPTGNGGPSTGAAPGPHASRLSPPALGRAPRSRSLAMRPVVAAD
jgi:hypothetical protein